MLFGETYQDVLPAFLDSSVMELRRAYAFDEIGGLKWEEKEVQQNISRDTITKAICNTLLPDTLRADFLNYQRPVTPFRIEEYSEYYST